jgi:hypothetical protein
MSRFGTNGAQATPMKNALIPLAPQIWDFTPAQPDRRAKTNPAKADFVAHLIAMALQAPQTRARRRAEPTDAAAAYRALGQWPTEPGSALSQSL